MYRAVVQPSACPASRRASSSASSSGIPASRSRRRAAATWSWMVLKAHRRRVFQFFGLIEGDRLVEELREIAVEDFDEPVRREVDPVIRDAVLREVVGADFLRALARAHLAAAVLRDRFLLLAHLHLVQPRA